jgi:hypothetical protein
MDYIWKAKRITGFGLKAKQGTVKKENCLFRKNENRTIKL